MDLEAGFMTDLDCHGSYSDRRLKMTIEDESDALDPGKRIEEMKLLFRGVNSGLSAQIAALRGKLTVKDAAALKIKIAELESTHMSLVRAEEAFHEKTKHDVANSGPDYDAIREEIGRALDRIRDAECAGGVFKRSER